MCRINEPLADSCLVCLGEFIPFYYITILATTVFFYREICPQLRFFVSKQKFLLAVAPLSDSS